MAAVRVDDEAFSDIRFIALAGLMGLSNYDALGRAIWLWKQCTQKGSYILSEAEVSAILPPDLLIRSGLGEKTEEGIRIKGTGGRIEWLKRLRKNSKKGGAANKARWLSEQEAAAGQDDSRVGPEPSALTLTPTLTLNTKTEEKKFSGLEGSGEVRREPPSNRVQRFLFRRKFGPPVSTQDVAAMFDNLRAAGVTDAEIDAEIDNPARNCGEFLNQFADRMLKAKQKATPKDGFSSLFQKELEKRRGNQDA